MARSVFQRVAISQLFPHSGFGASTSATSILSSLDWRLDLSILDCSLSLTGRPQHP